MVGLPGNVVVEVVEVVFVLPIVGEEGVVVVVLPIVVVERVSLPEVGVGLL